MSKTNTSPKISVITVSYNQGLYLEKCIQSVINQRYPNFEHIIIDGGSTDESIDVIRKYEEHLTYWVSEKDNGQSHAFNKGLEKATGEIIGWINSDDIYLNNCLIQASEYFTSHPRIDIVFSDYIYIDEHGEFIKFRKEIPFDFEIYRWTEDCYHANCAGFFRKEIFLELGGLDESLQNSMDYEFYLRAASRGFEIGHIKACWGAYRLHSQSKSISQPELLKHTVGTIAAIFQSQESKVISWPLKYLYKTIRLCKKIFNGSYFPFSSRKTFDYGN